MKRTAILVLLFCVIIPSAPDASDVRDAQLSSGIRNAEAYSRLLIRQAHADPQKAGALLKEALVASPDLPLVYFELSRHSLSPSAAGMLDSFDYVIQGIDAYGRNFLWSLTLMGSLFFAAVFSFLLSASILAFIRLFPDLPLLMHDIQEDPRRAGFLAALVVLSAISPLFLIAGILMLIGIYMKRSDRAVVYAYLVFLVCSPLVFKTASQIMQALSSGAMKAVVQVNESRGNTYAASVLGNGRDIPSAFSYALALKRQGLYSDAIPLFTSLLDRWPDPRVYVDLGNAYVGLYNFDESKKNALEEAARCYSKSVGIRPLASAYYNLSQVYREMLDFPKGEEYFAAALSINRTAVADYRSISGRTPNRIVADETLSRQEFWRYMRERFTSVFTFGMSLLPLSVLPVLALGLLAAFYLLTTQLRQKAYRCRKCGAILCVKCEKHITWGQMCPQCFSSLVRLDEMDARERVARILAIYEQQQKRRDRVRILSFVLPGVSFIFGGRVLTGILFLWPFLFLVLVPLTNWICVPDSNLVSHGFFSWLALCGAAVVFVASNIITRKRMVRGWL